MLVKAARGVEAGDRPFIGEFKVEDLDPTSSRAVAEYLSVLDDAAFGGATMPWAVGFVSTQTGNLRAGLVLPLISCVVMIGLLPLLAD